jgi:hypothetical protein
MLNHYQTDFDGYIKRDGCLLFSIFAWVCVYADLSMTTADIETLIKVLNIGREPALGDENDRLAMGVFVYDHAAVFNEAFKHFGSVFRAVYNGRIYMPWVESNRKVSFGERTGNALILQTKTDHGNGHFRTAFYDPWFPMPEMADLKSIRYYQIS